MPNAEMGDKTYQDTHGFDMVEIPIFQAHSSRKNDDVIEKETIIVGTKTMPREMWCKSYKFAWAIQCLHLLGLLQVVTILLRNRWGITYSEFYEDLLSHALLTSDSILHKELNNIDDLLNNVLQGHGFDQYVEGAEDISWPSEEASLLRILENIDKFYEQISSFIFQHYEDRIKKDNEAKTLINDIITYQRHLIMTWKTQKKKSISLNYNIHEYFNDLRAGKLGELVQGEHRYACVAYKNYDGDKATFSREIVWYGRKGGKFFNQIKPV
jgi:hypothetical protein